MLPLKEVWHEIFDFMCFHESVYHGPLRVPLGPFECLRKFAEIFESKGKSAVSTTPAINEKNFGKGGFFHILLRCCCLTHTKICYLLFTLMLRWRKADCVASVLGKISLLPVKNDHRCHCYRLWIISSVVVKGNKFIAGVMESMKIFLDFTKEQHV